MFTLVNEGIFIWLIIIFIEYLVFAGFSFLYHDNIFFPIFVIYLILKLDSNLVGALYKVDVDANDKDEGMCVCFLVFKNL
jgi:hypothetical protein